MNSPSISVLMSVYNGEPYLLESIGSLLKQTFSDFEMIIIDDHSSDNTAKLINSLEDSRIRLIKNEQNLGLAASLNKGIDYCRADLIARMDADDIADPQRLELQYEYLANNKSVGVLGSWFQVIGTDKVARPPISHEDIYTEMFFRCPIGHPTVMIRKQILQQVGGYNESLRSAQDYELWTRLIKHTKFGNIDQVLLQYRVHGNQITQKRRDEQRNNDLEIKKQLLVSHQVNYGLMEPLYLIAQNETVHNKKLLLSYSYMKTKAQKFENGFDTSLMSHKLTSKVYAHIMRRTVKLSFSELAMFILSDFFLQLTWRQKKSLLSKTLKEHLRLKPDQSLFAGKFSKK